MKKLNIQLVEFFLIDTTLAVSKFFFDVPEKKTYSIVTSQSSRVVATNKSGLLLVLQCLISDCNRNMNNFLVLTKPDAAATTR